MIPVRKTEKERMEGEREESSYLQTAEVTQVKKKLREKCQKIMHSKDNSLRKRSRHKGVCLVKALLKLKDY